MYILNVFNPYYQFFHPFFHTHILEMLNCIIFGRMFSVALTKLEERAYFDEICAHSRSEIRVGSKKCPYCSDFCPKYVEIFT